MQAARFPRVAGAMVLAAATALSLLAAGPALAQDPPPPDPPPKQEPQKPPPEQPEKTPPEQEAEKQEGEKQEAGEDPPGQEAGEQEAGEQEAEGGEPAQEPDPVVPEPDPRPVEVLIDGDPARDDRSSETDYVIVASVDDETKILEGQLRLTWTNRSRDTVSDLWFHLYHNAFSNNYSTHVWEARGRLRRGQRIKDGEWGWQRVTSLVDTRDGTDLMPTLRFGHPVEGREDDRTVFGVDLPRPVAPGEQIQVELSWTSQIPRLRRRTGYKDDFLFMAHWFPKLGVYEGGRGWNCHQFHRDTEFYSDFGTFDVTLSLAAKYHDGVIGASGVQVEEEIENDRVKVRFVAPSVADQAYVDPVTARVTGRKPRVHEFAWTASPLFKERIETFRYDEWAQRFPDEVAEVAGALGRDAQRLRLRDVEVRVMMQKDRIGQWRRHYEATCAALFFYGLWWGQYPYEQITVVDPAWGGGAAGGMEYPTLFTSGTQLFTRVEMQRPESVTVHEAGHQFWYGLVGNNEFEAAWLDEGFNSYTDSETLWRVYGKRRSASWYSGMPVWGVRPAALPAGGRVGDILGARDWTIPSLFEGQPEIPLQPLRSTGFVDWWRDQPWLCFHEHYEDPRWGDRSGYLRDPDTDPIQTFAFEHADRQSYRTNSYPRTAAALRTLSGVVGRDAFLRGMRRYSELWRYRHPYPEDFYAAFNAGAGVDVGWYFEDVFRGTGTLDWSVDVQQWKRPELEGYLQQPDGSFVMQASERAENGSPPPDDDEEDEEDLDDGTPRVYEVIVRRKGSLRLPLSIEVVFADGRTETFQWTREMQAASTWWKLPIESDPAKVTSVVLDPERLCYLDRDMTDNQWFVDEDPLVPARWAERVYTQYAHLLHWFLSTGG